MSTRLAHHGKEMSTRYSVKWDRKEFEEMPAETFSDGPYRLGSADTTLLGTVPNPEGWEAIYEFESSQVAAEALELWNFRYAEWLMVKK